MNDLRIHTEWDISVSLHSAIICLLCLINSMGVEGSIEDLFKAELQATGFEVSTSDRLTMDGFLSPKALYLTHGLWEMSGFNFWRHFLFF